MYDSSSGVLICKECLAYPNKLNTIKITSNLFDHGWDTISVMKVANAVAKYKEGENA